MYFWRCFLILITLLTTSVAGEFAAPSCVDILSYIQKNLPQYGILKYSDGFLYVDIEDEYIHKLVRLIEQEGFEEPPYFGEAHLVGAHISVMYSKETMEQGIKNISECGELIPFAVKECQIVHPPHLKEVDAAYIIVVESPRLHQIRKKYGLPQIAYPFHITIGMKPKVAQSA